VFYYFRYNFKNNYICFSNEKKNKNMKRALLVSVMSLFLLPLVHAQSFYARIGMGVSGGIAADYSMLYSYTNDGSTQSISAVPLRLGRGFNAIAAFGYKPSKYIGLEIGISEFIGFPNVADSVIKMPGGTSAQAKVQGNMFSLIPAIVISPGLKHVDPYARIGLIIGIHPTVNATAEYNNASINPPNEYKMIRQYYGGVAFGLNAAMGVSWIVNRLISLYAEFSFNSINYSPNYSEVIHFDKNGVDQLPTLTVKQTKTEYYHSIDPTVQIPDTNPDQALKKSVPFSNAGINFGVAFHF
jgi:hypothetical protein